MIGFATLGLLSIGAYLRLRRDRRTAPEARLRRLRIAAERHQAGAVSVRKTQEARTARDRHRELRRPESGRPALHHGRSGDHPPGPQWERRVRQFGGAPADGAGTPVREGVARARDPIPAQLRFSVLMRDGFRCRYCGRTASEPEIVLHVDHVVPLSAGGATSEANLLTACAECNLGKSTRAIVSAGS